MESLVVAFILTIIRNRQFTRLFPISSTGVYKPLPPMCFFPSLWSVEEGERCIDGTSCTSGLQREGHSIPFLVLSLQSPTWSSESAGASAPCSTSRRGSEAAPMTAGWGWTSTAGWGSGCRPPRWARPSWRCGCPGRGCCRRGEAWRWTRSAPISGGTQWFTAKKKKKIFSDSSSVGIHEILLAPMSFSPSRGAASYLSAVVLSTTL